MKIKTTRFGEIEVMQDRVYKFMHGLPGFPNEKSFALLPYQPDSPFAFLQSMTDPDLTFLVIDPFVFFSDYEFDLDDAALQEIGFIEGESPYILNIVTVPEKMADMTVNLLAPVVLNQRNRQGQQIVLEGTSYLIRHRLFPQDSLCGEGKS